MTIGKTVKMIREEKGFTKKEVYAGVISKTFSYYFEKGENTITVERLYKILKDLNITYDEFFLIHNNFKYEPYDKIYSEISLALNSNLSNLKKIYRDNYKSSDINKKVIASLSFSLYLLNTNQSLENDTVLFLKNYLISLKNPTIIDLELFQYALIIFFDQVDYLMLLMPTFERALEKYYQSGFRKESIELIIQELLLNYTQVLLINSRVEQAKSWQHNFLQRFPNVKSFEVILNIKCGKLLIELFDKQQKIRDEAASEYERILYFLKESFQTDLNLKSVYLLMKKMSKEKFNKI